MVGQVKGWKVQQIVFVGGTLGSVHVESFNKNMKALGVLESKWDLIRQKLVRRLLEEQMMMMPFICSYRNKNEPTAIYPSWVRQGVTVLLHTERWSAKSKGGRDSGQGS